jgi:hypothetical protein
MAIGIIALFRDDDEADDDGLELPAGDGDPPPGIPPPHLLL